MSKSPISNARAIPDAVLDAFAVSQQCSEMVTAPAFPIFTLYNRAKHTRTQNEIKSPQKIDRQ